MWVWVAGEAVAGVCGGYRVRDYLLCTNMNNSTGYCKQTNKQYQASCDVISVGSVAERRTKFMSYKF